MTNICLLEALIVIDEVWLPCEFENRTASVISFVLYRDKSRTKRMKNDSGIYVSSLTICSIVYKCICGTCLHVYVYFFKCVYTYVVLFTSVYVVLVYLCIMLVYTISGTSLSICGIVTECSDECRVYVHAGADQGCWRTGDQRGSSSPQRQSDRGQHQRWRWDDVSVIWSFIPTTCHICYTAW